MVATDNGPVWKVYAAPRSEDGRPGRRCIEREKIRSERHGAAGETGHIDILVRMK